MIASITFHWRPPLLAMLLSVLFWPPVMAAELAPHRADYSIRLDDARPGGLFVAVHGRMSLGMEKTCDGWIISQELAMQLETADGKSITQNMRFAAWESLDGKVYRFASRSMTGKIREDSKGMAKSGKDGNPGEATFTLPEAHTITLPEGTMFPVTHTAWLIERAQQGDRHAPRILFDGIGGSDPQEASTFIGRRIAPSDHGTQITNPLVQRPGWNMRLALYPLGSLASEPEYEAEVLQLDNGVAPRMLLDYQAYRVILDMEEIEAIAPPVC